jgi:hypothetical protein
LFPHAVESISKSTQNIRTIPKSSMLLGVDDESTGMCRYVAAFFYSVALTGGLPRC